MLRVLLRLVGNSLEVGQIIDIIITKVSDRAITILLLLTRTINIPLDIT